MPTVQQIIDTVLKEVPNAPFPDTVDTIKVGDGSAEVRGIVTTFLASHEVLQKAVDLGANFVICHEPLFYNHLDETDWLEKDSVYQAKRKFIEDNGLVIWRFHDHWHRHEPDGIMTGMMRALGWESENYVTTLPRQPLIDIINHIKAKLGAKTVRVVGSLDMLCERVSFMMGHPGGRWQIGALSYPELDVLIAGEINEWETNEYVRDALTQGKAKALVVIGHEISEEAGMAYFAEWLGERVAEVPITHVATGDAIQTV